MSDSDVSLIPAIIQDIKTKEVLMLDFIDKNVKLKNYITNIKKLIKREYSSKTRHIFPPLGKQFISDVANPNPEGDIRMPKIYDGGLRNKYKNEKEQKNY